MDDFRIDAHKLIYHPRRVADWLSGGNVCPLYVEISPCSACNHRCIFCAFDYLGHKPKFFDPVVLKKFIGQIAAAGVKSVLFSGEGETLLYKQLSEMVAFAKRRGIDVAVATNAVLLSAEVAGRIIPHLSWLRVSLNAATPQSYARIHGTRPDDFAKVIANIKTAVLLRRRAHASCTIGVQCLLLKENQRECEQLAGVLQNTGVDYLSIKPYSQHPLSINRLKKGLDYNKLRALEHRVRGYETKHFKVIFRSHAMNKIASERSYEKCNGLPFYAHLTTEGDLYACSSFLGDKRFCYGNVYKSSFSEIWNGKKRRQFMAMMDKRWDIHDCREVCRLDEINRYLWELKHPREHVNFI